MKWLIWFLAVFVLLIISSGVFSQLHFLAIIPGLILIFGAVAISLEDGPELFFILLTSGILMDFVSGLPDGIMLLSLMFSAFCIYALVSWFISKEFNIGILFLSSGLMTLLFFVAVLGFGKIFDLLGFEVNLEYSYLLTHTFVWYFGLNLLLTYPIYVYYLAIKQLQHKTQKTK